MELLGEGRRRRGHARNRPSDDEEVSIVSNSESEAVCCGNRYEHFVTSIRWSGRGHRDMDFDFLSSREVDSAGKLGWVCSYCGVKFTFKSSTSVGVISDGSISGVGRDERAPFADGVGLTMPAH